mmetsp:Transcript_14904/g.19506  ORF Transcript_14904/g.19506 Transcript_14904/m.19506 type:complete len:109 (-) Transcript_14904:59-385(-)
MAAEEVATAFVNHFYQGFDSDPMSLAGLFNPNSMMTFEAQQYGGPQAIIAKLKTIGTVKHSVKSTDVQPGTSESAMLVVVTGAISIGGDKPWHFCDMFQLLVSIGPGA